MLSAETHRGNPEANGGESYGRFLYNRFRYYDPSKGGYLSLDPIGQFGIIEAETDPIRDNHINFLMDGRLYVGNIGVDGIDGLRVGTPHLYNYAVNDPINLIDPTGEVTLRQVSNFAAGFGNVVSLGLTGAINDATGASSVVDECSGAYGAGTAAGWAHAAVTGGLGLARAAGWRAAFSKYKHGGGGFNVSKGGVRRFGADWHSFKHNGVTKSRPHYHRGPTKSQRKKHRPWQGGW